MSEGHKRNYCKDCAKKAYNYYREYGFVGVIRNSLNWLLADSDRLTALSTFFIFLATTVAVGVGIAQWIALSRTDHKIGEQLALFAAEQRPRINFKGIGTLFILDVNGTPWVGFPITWINNGNIQSKKLTVIGSCNDAPWQPWRNEITKQPQWGKQKWVLAPKSDWSFIQCWQSAERLSFRSTDRDPFYIFGQATYVDTLSGNETRHITRFCVQASAFRKSASGDSFSANFGVCDGNCTDEECEQYVDPESVPYDYKPTAGRSDKAAPAPAQP